MDLMFDSMPLIYDMIDDDMRLITMRFNNDTSSFSDEDQLTLSGCSNLLDDFYFSTPQPSSLNSSTSSFCSLSSGISSTSSTPSYELSPVLQSPQLGTQLTTMQSSSIYDDINTYALSKFNTNANMNTVDQPYGFFSNQSYQTINPSDLNASHNSPNLFNPANQNHQHLAYLENNDHALYHKQVGSQQSRQSHANSKLASSFNVPSPVACKRMKYAHEAAQVQQQQVNVYCNSDGDSIFSNESNDSNSSCNDSSTNNLSSSVSTFSSTSPSPSLATSVQVVDSTSFLPTAINTPSTSNQINIIKINKDLMTNGADATKHIIHYKHLINKTSLLTTTSALAANLEATSPVTSTTVINDANSILCNRSEKVFPKPPFSYSCLIAMALRNSDSGTLPVSDIYEFIIENFPYYKTARDGWKNSIRHNLSLNKCFEKIENPVNGSKKGCLWALNPEKCKKLEEECKRCRQRDLINIRLSMSRPDELTKIERGEQRIKKVQANPTQRKVLDSATTNHHASSLTNCHAINLTSISASNSLATITPTTICINKNVNNNNQISIEKLTNSNNNNINNNNHIIHLNNIKTEHLVDQNNPLFYNNSANNTDSKFLINWTNNQAPIANTVKIAANDRQPNDKSSTIKQEEEFYVKIEYVEDDRF